MRLLREGDAVVDGGGSRMNRRWGFSLAGSSAAAGEELLVAPSARLDGGEAAGEAAVRGAGPAPNRGVVERSVSRGEGRSVVMAWRAGRALMPTLGSGTLTFGREESWPYGFWPTPGGGTAWAGACATPAAPWAGAPNEEPKLPKLNPVPAGWLVG